jgi:hypothetical protein
MTSSIIRLSIAASCILALSACATEQNTLAQAETRTLPMQRLLKDTPNGTTLHDDCMRRYWDNKIMYNQCLKGQISFLQFVIPGKQEWLGPADERSKD